MFIVSIGSLSEKAKFEDSAVSIGEVNSKLENAITAKQEAEAKLTTLENKVSQYEAEITELKAKVWFLVFNAFTSLERLSADKC